MILKHAMFEKRQFSFSYLDVLTHKEKSFSSFHKWAWRFLWWADRGKNPYFVQARSKSQYQFIFMAHHMLRALKIEFRKICKLYSAKYWEKKQ